MSKAYVYIMTNTRKTVLYTGVTTSLVDRVADHKDRINRRSFTFRYNVDQLVYYETFDSIDQAIDREKQIKKGNRARKEGLINSMNPEWRDLGTELL